MVPTHQVDGYKKRKQRDITDPGTALIWNKYPLIAQVVRSALAVPAPSAPSERAFAQAGLVMETIVLLKGYWEAADEFPRSSSN